MTQTPPYQDLDDRVAVVTGANSGIGRAIAETLSTAGAQVVGLDISERPNDDGPRFDDVVDEGELVVGDVSDADDVARAVEVAESYGPPSVAVNNAGIAGHGRIEDVAADEWRQSFAVHVDGTYNVCRELLPEMVERGEGRVVNVSSVAGLRGFGHAADYSAAKGAIASLTRQLAIDFSPEGLRINAVAPGFIETAMNASVWRDRADTDHWIDYETADRKTLLPRFGQPQDVADVVAFLASDASAFVTGQVLPVDGGWTSW